MRIALPVYILLKCACAAAVFLSSTTQGWAEETEEEEPIPSSIDESLVRIERAFRPPPPPPAALYPELRKTLQEAPPFLRDSQIEIYLRNFYRNNTNDDQSKSEAWAGGGWISIRSGWLADLLSFGTTFYTSQPIYAPQDRDGTQLLDTGQRGYSALGQLYARLKIAEENYFTAGLYTYDTPYLSRNDIRMTPYTFEGYVLQGSTGGGEDGRPNVRYGIGYISDMKSWTSDEFVSMSRAAGAAVDRGVALAGALLSFGNVSVGGIDYYSNDIINIGYAEAKYVVRLPDKVDLMLSAQYVDQRSIGNDLLTGSPFSTNLFGLRSEIGRDGAILTLAYTAAGMGADLRRPWSGNPVYTGSLLRGFDRAGEQATLIKVSYDFSDQGLTGVSAYAHYSHGWTSAGISPLSENELDFTVQWRPEWKALKGLWLRGIYCLAETTQAGTQTRLRDLRLIANYTFLLF